MIEFRVVIIYRENKGEKKKKNAGILVCFSEFFWVCEASQVLVIWWLRWGLGSGGLRVFWWWPRSGFMEFFLGFCTRFFWVCGCFGR